MSHKKQIVKLVGLAIALTTAISLPVAVAAAGGPPENRGLGRGHTAIAADAAAAGADLDSNEQSILTEFLIDEHKALATYESIMADFGEVQPFASIARAEKQHIAALERVFTRYAVALPQIPTFDIPSFGSVEEAAAAAAQAEIDNAALYDRLLGEIDNADIVRVAGNLRDASLNNHLPAFEAAATGKSVAGEAQASGPQRGGSPTGGMERRQTARGRTTQARALGTCCHAYQQGTFRSR
jgi:hypothetical protein